MVFHKKLAITIIVIAALCIGLTFMPVAKEQVTCGGEGMIQSLFTRMPYLYHHDGRRIYIVIAVFLTILVAAIVLAVTYLITKKQACLNIAMCCLILGGIAFLLSAGLTIFYRTEY